MAKVYVLGAGASKALNSNAPNMAQLFSIALESFPDRERTSIETFLEDLYGCSKTEVSFRLPLLEDVLSQTDYCIVNNLPLSSHYDVQKLRLLRSQLIFAIGTALKRMDNHSDKDFINQFLANVSPEDSIISLNYDLVIDNGILHKWYEVNYRIPIRFIAFASENSPPLYKLHGSMNWLYCPVCGEIEVTHGLKMAPETYDLSKRCPQCKTPYEPIIITPSFLKDYSNSYVGQIWREAKQKLERADEVIFVGYSMPDADMMLRIFFTRALFTNRLLRKHRRKQAECTVSVVDYVEPKLPLDPKSDWKSATHERYVRLFGNINYDSTGFGEYINRGCKMQA